MVGAASKKCQVFKRTLDKASLRWHAFGMSHRPFKDKVYGQFARIGQALASGRRLELLDLLAQGPRNVEALAEETEMSVANVSQHLQVLRDARLVESERAGTRVFYRLASRSVLKLWLTLRDAAEEQLAEVDWIKREFAPERDEGLIARDVLAQLAGEGKVVLIDVRPASEFAHGHLPGAVSIPVEELASRVESLPRDKKIVAYCRGEYCLFADEAVRLLRERGYDATRLEGGWPEWLIEGRDVVAAGG